MKHTPLFKIHAAAVVAGFLFIASFWSSSVIAELFFNHAEVAAVKQAIAYALIIFVPLMAVGGITGKKLALPRSLMPKIALNGALVLLPCALVLNYLAQNSQFGTLFYSIQAVELVAGAINSTMITLHLRRLGLGCPQRCCKNYQIGSLKTKTRILLAKLFSGCLNKAKHHTTNPCKNQTDSVSFSHFCRLLRVIACNVLINNQ